MPLYEIYKFAVIQKAVAVIDSGNHFVYFLHGDDTTSTDVQTSHYESAEREREVIKVKSEKKSFEQK